MRISAVVVTYKRYELLRKVLESVFNQTYPIHAIYIIDNSPNPILESDDKRVKYMPQPKNIGGAGGFNLGIKSAAIDGADYIWTLDDDAIPELNSLEKLLYSNLILSKKENVSFTCSKVMWGDSNEYALMNIPSFSGNCIQSYSDQLPVLKVNHCSFVSCLIKVEAIYEYGLPISDFFIWYDDVEYTRRLLKYGNGYLVLNSVVKHYMHNNIGANYSFINNENLFKFTYGARNESYYRIKNYGIRSWLVFFKRVLREMNVGSISSIIKLKIIKAMLRGLVFSPNIEVIDS